MRTLVRFGIFTFAISLIFFYIGKYITCGTDTSTFMFEENNFNF